MKYIKSYENEELNLQIGDYILLDMNELRKDIDFETYEIKDNKAIITSISKVTDTTNMYQIEFCNGTNPEFAVIISGEIKRLLTPKEIELFKMKRSQNKYNL